MIKLITDTASDITHSEAEDWGIELITLRVAFGDVPYHQVEDENFEAFYSLLNEVKELPTTSQPAPTEFIERFEEAQNKKDDLIYICLSSGLSSTYQNALVAKDLVGYENIHIIDSQQAVMGQRLLVEYAVRLREKGMTAKQIVACVGEASGRVILYGALDKLKYLRKGVRIPRSTELIGAAMGIKPLVQLKDGVIVMAGKARGHAGAVTGMIRLIDENAAVDPAAPVYFGYTQDAIPCRNFRMLCTTRYRYENVRQVPVGPVIGTHVGPRAMAIAYLACSR